MATYHLLLSNDDGIEAPGLLALHDALAAAGHRLTVVAPKGERSASSHAIRVWHDIPVQRVERDGKFFGYAVDSTPADCVKFALGTVLSDDRPDLVVSGINPGPNFGDAVFYSGTCAVAAEAGFYGVPAIAVSIGGRWEDRKDFRAAAAFAALLAGRYTELPLGQHQFLNINAPNLPPEKIRGSVVTRMGRAKYIDHFVERRREEDGTVVWSNRGNSMELSADDGTGEIDDLAVETDFISVTPMLLDITHHAALARCREALAAIAPAARHRPEEGHHAPRHVEEMSPFVQVEGATEDDGDSKGD